MQIPPQFCPRTAGLLAACLLPATLAFAGPPVDSVVVFNEIMYHPTDPGEAGEWIELHNQMGVNIDLSDWELTGGVNYTFPDGTVITGGGYLLVAKTPAMVPGSMGPWTGSLKNSSETIRLRDKNARLMDEVDYSDSGSWPVAADGSGVSLTKRNEDFSSPDAAHWTISAQTGGTPGAANFPPPPPPVTASLITLRSPWKYNNIGTDPGASWKDEAYDDTQVGWQTGTAVFDFGNTSVYDDYPNGVPPTGNQEITGVTIAAKSSEATSAGLNRAAVNCINGSGLTAGGTHGITAAGTMWMSNGTSLTPFDPLPATITFDLGSVQNLTSLHVWNYNEFGTSSATNRGSKTVEILVAATAGGAFTSVGTFTFNQASGLANEAGQVIPMVQSGVRQVQFNITANWGGAGGFAGLSEVKFYNDQPAAAQPPPLHRENMRSVLPNSGANSDGTLISPGLRDPHYINTADNLGAYVEIGNPAWLGSDGASQWIGPTSNGSDNVAAATLTYRLNVDLTGWKKDASVISVYASADNSFDRMRVNGTVLNLTASGFSQFYGPFSVPAANLLDGNNVIEFDWTNADGPGPNPGGFRVKWDATGAPSLATTTLAANPVTTRYRRKFTWNGNPASVYQLRLEHILDDGAVFYLNGQELLRTNMPAGAVTNTTTASTEVQYPKFSGIKNVPATAFHTGENTLAVEVHQASASNADALFGATLDLTEIPPAPTAPPSLALNEIAGATAAAGGFFVELRNTGTSALNLTGYRIATSSGASVTLGNTTLAAGGLLSLNEAALGFRPADGDKLFFYTPGSARVVDAVIIKNKSQARTGSGVWQTPAASTAGGANTFSIPDSIVINEIMYAHMPLYLSTGTTEDPEEWVELYNRSAAPVDLNGWGVKGGADFTFGPVSIPAGGYLVVAKNRLALAAKYPAITIVGDWSGSLSNSGDTVRIEDANGNTVNEVHYLTGGRWDERADGGGSSLELKNPAMDNSQPEAWAGSDESGKSVWQTFTYTGAATPPAGSNDPTNYNEFIAGLLSSGECLIDDVSVIDQSAANAQLIQDGGFAAGNASKWRLLGTHGRSGVVTIGGDPALKIVATGPTEHMHNHCETTLKNGATYPAIVSSHVYAISFRAKWISGCPRLNTRLYFNRLDRQSLLPVPANTGTPGAVNSRFVALAQPVLSGLSHDPVVPAAGQTVAVRFTASASVPVASATLKWQKDESGFWSDAAMALNDAGQFEGTIPGQTAGSLVQFYVVAQGANGSSVNFPAGGTASRAMVRWKDAIVPPGPGYGLRLLMPKADADFLHAITNVMSNDYMPCTMVYRESEVFYDAGVHLKSSERGRYGDPRLGFAISFDPAHKFRGVHEGINLDRSAYGPGTSGSGFGQVDIINQIFTSRAGGVPTMYNDMIYLIAPRSTHNGSAQMTMAEFNDVYLDSQYNNGAASPTFKFDLVYFPTSQTGGIEGLKNAQPDDVRGVNIGALTGASKEDYRWNFLIGNARVGDDYSRILAFNTAFRLLSQGNSSQIAAAIDVDQWLRTSAAMSLIDSNDSYSTGGLPHNLKLYVRPNDGRVIYLPWDADFSKQPTNFAVEGNADLQRIVAASPANRRLFYGHLQDLIATSFNTTYLTPWVNHLKTYNTAGGNWDEILTFVAARAAFVTSDYTAKYPNVAFSITQNGGADFSTASSLVTLAGQGWINVRDIRLQGVAQPLTVTWTGANTWQVQLPVAPGPNVYNLEAVNYQGTVVGTDTITVTGTGAVVAASAANIVFSEINYHPGDPTAAEIAAGFTDQEDFEFVELRNISAVAVDVSNCRFDTGLTYTIAAGTTIPAGGTLVIPRRTAAFNVRYPGVATAAQYYVAGGNTLSNSGEELSLLDASGKDIKRFTYKDSAPWPAAADGAGATLVLVSPGLNPDHNDPLNWRASTALNGNPGTSDSTPPPANPSGDNNNNGVSNLAEYAMGPGGGISDVAFAGSTIQFSVPRAAGSDARFSVETAGSLLTWTEAPATLIARTPATGGGEILTFSIPAPAGLPQRLFVRVKILIP
jgi:hypothetical protein